MAVTIGADVVPSGTRSLGYTAAKWAYFNGVKPVLVATTTSIPSAGSTVTINIAGLTNNHYLVAWNFSISAENNPPVDLSWTTSSGSCTITNTSSDTVSETITPVFVCNFT